MVPRGGRGRVVILAGLIVLLGWAVRSTRSVLRNETGGPLRDVVVTVKSGSGAVPKTTRVPPLAHGQEHEMTWGKLDVWVTVSYGMDGKVVSHSQYLDLWTSETYVVALRPGGTVRGDYRH